MSMCLGFNNQLQVEGRNYHIQTEDLGTQRGVIITHVFCEGRVVESIKSAYARGKFSPHRLQHQMRQQHAQMVKAIAEGTLPAAMDQRPEVYRAFAKLLENAVELPDAPSDIEQLNYFSGRLSAEQEHSVKSEHQALLLPLKADSESPMYLLDKSPFNISGLGDLGPGNQRTYQFIHDEESGWRLVSSANNQRSRRLSYGDVVQLGRRRYKFQPPIPKNYQGPSYQTLSPLPQPVPIAIPSNLREGMVYIPSAEISSPYGMRGIPAFLLDQHLVTNLDYAVYVREGGGLPPRHWPNGLLPAAMKHLPVVGITFAQARAYARWCGKRLPTTLEWEAAARGREQRNYPWGDSFEPENCCSRESSCYGPAETGSFSAGVSIDGAYDLVGNVWEWTEPCSGYRCPELDLVWVMGGAYNTDCGRYNRFPRTTVHRDEAFEYLGFRCAADVPAGS